MYNFQIAGLVFPLENLSLWFPDLILNANGGSRDLLKVKG